MMDDTFGFQRFYSARYNGDLSLLVRVLTRCSCVHQTKEALFTILGDLRPGDHFNFISFSNRVKVWQPGRLVPVTPNNVRDAKKFIFMLPTSGGETLATVLQLQSNII